MNRLEEIKEMHERCKKGMVNEDRIYTAYEEDIEYLLNEVERLNNVLRTISVPMPGSRDNELVLYYERIAQEALQQKDPTPE